MARLLGVWTAVRPRLRGGRPIRSSSGADAQARRQHGRSSTPTAAGRGALRACLMNRVSVAVLNRAYQAASRNSRERVLDLSESMFPVARKMLYFSTLRNARLPRVSKWLSHSRASRSTLTRSSGDLARDPVPIALASAKWFGGVRRWLRFTGEGICFALNFPRSSRSAAFASYLDGVLQRCGGWPNIIKDSRLSAAIVGATYPEYEAFRALYVHDRSGASVSVWSSLSA